MLFQKRTSCFFLRVSEKLQRVRNLAAHNRAYKIDDIVFKDFFEKLDKSDQQNVEKITARIYADRKERVRTFKQINAKDQFLLLLVWFTIHVRTEIDKIVDVKILDG